MAGFGSIAPSYDPMTGLPITQPEEPPAAAAPPEPQGKLSRMFGSLMGTNFGQPRYQLWPEKMVRSGVSLAHDVMTGEEPINAADPITGEMQTSPRVIERANRPDEPYHALLDAPKGAR